MASSSRRRWRRWGRRHPPPGGRYSLVAISLVVVALRWVNEKTLSCDLAGRERTELSRLMRTDDVGHGLLGRMGLMVAQGRTLLAPLTSNVGNRIRGHHGVVVINP
jgi:hypothetical protein